MMPFIRISIVVFLMCGCQEGMTYIHHHQPTRLTAIPASAFHVPGDNGGVWVYVKEMHPHLNNAYLELFHPTNGEKIDSGRFVAICPLTQLSKLLDPNRQISSWKRDTLWFKSEKGNEVCFMLKSNIR